MKLLSAFGLGILAVMLWLTALSAVGLQPGGVAEGVCLRHAPGEWYESVDARAEASVVPPRLRCELLNTRTGERVTWSSDHESLPLFWLGTAAAVAAAGLVLWAGVERLRRRTSRHHPAVDAGDTAG